MAACDDQGVTEPMVSGAVQTVKSPCAQRTVHRVMSSLTRDRAAHGSEVNILGSGSLVGPKPGDIWR